MFHIDHYRLFPWPLLAQTHSTMAPRDRKPTNATNESVAAVGCVECARQRAGAIEQAEDAALQSIYQYPQATSLLRQHPKIHSASLPSRSVSILSDLCTFDEKYYKIM